MTRKIISGIAVAAIVLALGMGTQISAFAMTDPQSEAAKKMTSQTFVANDTMMLVATPILHKGGNTTFTLVPRPSENVDGIQTPKSTPDLIMVAHTSSNGGKPTFTWIPRPVEGIDGIPLPNSTQQNLVTLADPPQSSDPNSMILVATPIVHKGDKVIFTLVPQPVENVDGIQTPKSTPDLIMVEHTSPTDGKPVYTWIPRPAEGIDGIPIPKPTPNG